MAAETYKKKCSECGENFTVLIGHDGGDWHGQYDLCIEALKERIGALEERIGDLKRIQPFSTSQSC